MVLQRTRRFGLNCCGDCADLDDLLVQINRAREQAHQEGFDALRFWYDSRAEEFYLEGTRSETTTERMNREEFEITQQNQMRQAVELSLIDQLRELSDIELQRILNLVKKVPT